LGPKNVIGAFGELHPRTLEAVGSEGPVAGFELFLNDISAPKLRSTRAKPKLVLSEFMPTQRDFAFLADQSVKAADIVKAAAAAEHALVAHVDVLRRRGDEIDAAAARSSPKLKRKPARASEDRTLRTTLLAFFTAALVVVSGQSKATPRNIDECEKIQAADAYNLCLASFGPVARGHHALADGDVGGKQEETVSSVSRHVEAAAVGRSRHGHRHAFRRGSSLHRWARHSSGHRTRAVFRVKHGHHTAMAFSVV
jgi:hypothetical protein